MNESLKQCYKLFYAAPKRRPGPWPKTKLRGLKAVRHEGSPVVYKGYVLTVFTVVRHVRPSRSPEQV